MAKTSKRVRDAKTGEFLPTKAAKSRPATTVTETLKVGPSKKRKPSK